MILACLGLTLLVTELGFLQRIFDTTSLTAEQWGICLLAGLVALALARDRQVHPAAHRLGVDRAGCDRAAPGPQRPS